MVRASNKPFVMSSSSEKDSANRSHDGTTRLSRRLSGTNSDHDATPLPSAKRLRCTVRNWFKCCTEIDGMPIEFHCDACERVLSSTRAKNKPQHLLTSREFQCYKAWTRQSKDVAPAKMGHWKLIMGCIEIDLRIDATALLDDDDDNNDGDENEETIVEDMETETEQKFKESQL